MKKATILFIVSMLWSGIAFAQLKLRPDAFPSEPENLEKRGITMATTVNDMASWDRYPTYDTYLTMMARWAETFPTLCHVDTIGTSIQGRLILSMYIAPLRPSGTSPETGEELEERPEFFYSSTIHGDEVTGYVMMLRLIDTLLTSYGISPELTDLMNRTRISINPLANPDGTYHNSDTTIRGAQRENADGIDLNRNFPNPFFPAKTTIPQENQAMIDYFTEHRFRLSANLHGGAEVMNYPWDSFTSRDNPHPEAEWWIDVCKRFVDTSRTYNNSHFRDTYTCGYTAGGDWYVISGGRQDYVNAVHNCLEMTMEISTQKTLSSDRLPEYWHFLAPSFINYIAEIHNLPESTGITPARDHELTLGPNPTTGIITVSGAEDATIKLRDLQGRTILTQEASQSNTLDISHLNSGIYFLRIDEKTIKIIKL